MRCETALSVGRQEAGGWRTRAAPGTAVYGSERRLSSWGETSSIPVTGIKSPPATLAAARACCCLRFSALSLVGWSPPRDARLVLVLGQRGGLVELQPLLPREPVEAHAWVASQFSFLDLPINYFLATSKAMF